MMSSDIRGGDRLDKIERDIREADRAAGRDPDRGIALIASSHPQTGPAADHDLDPAALETGEAEYDDNGRIISITPAPSTTMAASKTFYIPQDVYAKPGLTPQDFKAEIERRLASGLVAPTGWSSTTKPTEANDLTEDSLSAAIERITAMAAAAGEKIEFTTKNLKISLTPGDVVTDMDPLATLRAESMRPRLVGEHMTTAEIEDNVTPYRFYKYAEYPGMSYFRDLSAGSPGMAAVLLRYNIATDSYCRISTAEEISAAEDWRAGRSTPEQFNISLGTEEPLEHAKIRFEILHAAAAALTPGPIVAVSTNYSSPVQIGAAVSWSKGPAPSAADTVVHHKEKATDAAAIALDWAQKRIVYLAGDPVLTAESLVAARKEIDDSYLSIPPMLICGPGNEDVVVAAYDLLPGGCLVTMAPVPLLRSDRSWCLIGGTKIALSTPK